MKIAKILTMTFSIICILSMSYVPLSNAIERDYSVFIISPGSSLIMSDTLSFTADGAIYIDSSYGSGTYIELGSSFIGSFLATDLFPKPAIMTVMGMLIDPMILAIGITNIDGNISVFYLTGRLLYDYDYEEE